ncbi:VOC family protein [Myxococcus faecalis]|uniref:VOC family protein n=1 Tax=Myxococcus faecalis TaxID=3115646 RepID=UPI003CEB0D68
MKLSARGEEVLAAINDSGLSVEEKAVLARALQKSVARAGLLLGHLSFGVRDIARAIAFYDAALAPLGYTRVWSSERSAGYGPEGEGDTLALFLRPEATPPGDGFHLAFNAPSREAVDAFHAACLNHGGKDQGAPGLRPHYSDTYYACFVTDPDGHKLEAVHQLG